MPLSAFLAAAAHTPTEGDAASGFNPGFMLYVVATMLPLLAFVLLLLRGGLLHFLRPYKHGGLGQTLWNVLDFEHQGKGPAYISTIAIGGAFVLAALGFILYAGDPSHGDALAQRWSGGIEWLRLDWAGDPATNQQIAALRSEHTGTAAELAEKIAKIQRSAPKQDPRGSVVLELGYKIDNLTTIMFLMVTFIATLIHVFSIGYMSEELQDTVEDHHVHAADGGHFKRRGRFGRFFMFLSLFCFSMLNLIIADNLFQIFISWELVGICSYLLIGFYYERQSASNAANKAFITNRVGDAGFIIGLLIIWTYVGTFNFDAMFSRLRAPTHDHHDGEIQLAGQFVRVTEIDRDKAGPIVRLDPQGDQVLLMGHLHAAQLTHYQLDPKGDPLKPRPLRDEKTNALIPLAPEKMATLSVRERPVNILNPMDSGTPNIMPYWLLVTAGLGIFLGCVGKSAQFPLSVWLPDAMEGPTPVSALIHAATMVAAGVYLVARVYPIFTPEVLLTIAYTGGITLFVAATIALVMNDIKKVLAYSTVSQLGYMMLALGVGGWTAGLMHLLTHAFFKALLFLGSGAVIYGCHHEQDMRKMGGLFKKMPITALTMLVGVLAIAGTPLFAGWYSKDAILAMAMGYAHHNTHHLMLFILPLLTAGITTFYMFRMWFLTFTGEPKDHHVHEHAHEAPRLMTVPLVLLAIFSVCVAWGWPLWDATASQMEHHLHHVMAHSHEKLNASYLSVLTDFGAINDPGHGHVEMWPQEHYHPGSDRERAKSHLLHNTAGLLALLSAGLGFVFAYVVYIQRALDPADAVEQFPGVYKFLNAKWAFDELYSVLFVRPSLVVAHWCRWFDSVVIDGLVDFIARISVGFARLNGKFDFGVIDGLANLIATVAYGVAGWLRGWQTGFLRSYVLFLVMAAVGIFALLKWLVTQATAGQ